MSNHLTFGKTSFTVTTYGKWTQEAFIEKFKGKITGVDIKDVYSAIVKEYKKLNKSGTKKVAEKTNPES